MSPRSPSQELFEFAIELRRLAYTVPDGCEDPLIRLSERMAHTAEQLDRATISAAVRLPEAR
jgi:hypothetical protein